MDPATYIQRYPILSNYIFWTKEGGFLLVGLQYCQELAKFFDYKFYSHGHSLQNILNQEELESMINLDPRQYLNEMSNGASIKKCFIKKRFFLDSLVTYLLFIKSILVLTLPKWKELSWIPVLINKIDKRCQDIKTLKINLLYYHNTL